MNCLALRLMIVIGVVGCGGMVATAQGEPAGVAALGTFVRIEHRSSDPAALEIAEVQVYSGDVNIASMGEARQSGAWGWGEGKFDAELALTVSRMGMSTTTTPLR